MNVLSREKILAVDDLQIRAVDVAEWGGSVNVRVLSGHYRAEFLKIVRNNKEGVPDDFMARLLVYTVCDESGTPIFKPDDIEKLQGKNSQALEKVFEAAAELNGLSESGREKIAGE